VTEPADAAGRKLKSGVALRLGRMVMGEPACLRAMARRPVSARPGMAGPGPDRSNGGAMEGSAALRSLQEQS
jgi:hypothetical protein